MRSFFTSQLDFHPRFDSYYGRGCIKVDNRCMGYGIRVQERFLFELRPGFPIPRGYINPIKSFAELNLSFSPHSNLVSCSSFVASPEEPELFRNQFAWYGVTLYRK